MHIVVRRSGGFAGTSRTWRVDTEACPDPDAWSDLVDDLPQEAPAAAGGPVTIPGRALDGPWATLVDRVRDEGEPA
jgi:hypothetical protein